MLPNASLEARSTLSGLSVRTLFLFSLLPGIVAGVLLLFIFISDKRDDLASGALQTAKALAQAIEKDLAGVSNVLRVLSTSESLRTGDYQRFHERATEIVSGEALVDVIALIDRSGQQMLNTHRPFGSDLPPPALPELVKKTIDSGRQQVSDLYFGKISGKPYVSVQIPVKSRGEMLSLIMAIPAERLARAMVDLDLPEGWVAAIVDTQGRVIARSVNHDKAVGKSATPDYIERTGREAEGVFPSQSLDEVLTYVAFTRMKSTGWVASVAMPRRVLYQSTLWPIALTALLVLLSSAVGLVIVKIFSRKVTASIQALDEATHRAALGELDAVEIPPKAPKELARLADRFNRMYHARSDLEQAKDRLNQALLLLNEVNTSMLIATDEATLLNQVCKAVVEYGGYKLAWIGIPGADPEKTVLPVAVYGANADYLRSVRISWGENEYGNGPTGLAIRSGTTQIVGNLPEASNMAPWASVAKIVDHQSSIAIPLHAEGRPIGALSIYSGIPGGFSDEQVATLEKLASNLAFGIDRLRTRVQLASTNKELQSFTYAASHDIKAPLQRIVAFTDLIDHRYRADLPADSATMFDFIRDNAKRISQLVEDLLAHAQIEQTSMALQPVSVRSVVQRVVDEHEQAIQDAGAGIEYAVPDIVVRANPLALTQALRNLIGNAIKYSSHAENPRIQVGGEQKGGLLQLWVQDNGVGFDMAYHDKIFEIFRRLHTHSEFSGSGVGLAIVKKAIERMGGRVWATSTPGEGATFFVELKVEEIGTLPAEKLGAAAGLQG